jgi:hypothetical protein
LWIDVGWGEGEEERGEMEEEKISLGGEEGGGEHGWVDSVEGGDSDARARGEGD